MPGLSFFVQAIVRARSARHPRATRSRSVKIRKIRSIRVPWLVFRFSRRPIIRKTWGNGSHRSAGSRRIAPRALIAPCARATKNLVTPSSGGIHAPVGLGESCGRESREFGANPTLRMTGQSRPSNGVGGRRGGILALGWKVLLFIAVSTNTADARTGATDALRHAVGFASASRHSRPDDPRSAAC